MNLTNKKRIFDILFCSFLFFIVLSTDKVYAYEERGCLYKLVGGSSEVVAQQDVTGLVKVRMQPSINYEMKELGQLDSGCPPYLLKSSTIGYLSFSFRNDPNYTPNSNIIYELYSFAEEVSTKVEYDPNDNPEVNSCEDLIGEEVIDVIQEIFNWIRIAIPIIIIVMTIIDFSKSLFMDEESMKKSQKKFIKRLIIGIAIFFIPTLVMGILELINKIAEWNWIKAGICGLK